MGFTKMWATVDEVGYGRGGGLWWRRWAASVATTFPRGHENLGIFSPTVTVTNLRKRSLKQ